MMVGKINAVEPWVILKLVLALALGAMILSGVVARPPRRSFPRADLRVVVMAAFGLYAVGLAASLSHHIGVAMLVYASGIAFSTLAVWLSRGRDGRQPPPSEDPDDPPGGPDEPLGFDWEGFERQFRTYASRRDRRPAPTA